MGFFLPSPCQATLPHSGTPPLLTPLPSPESSRVVFLLSQPGGTRTVCLSLALLVRTPHPPAPSPFCSTRRHGHRRLDVSPDLGQHPAGCHPHHQRQRGRPILHQPHRIGTCRSVSELRGVRAGSGPRVECASVYRFQAHIPWSTQTGCPVSNAHSPTCFAPQPSDPFRFRQL